MTILGFVLSKYVALRHDGASVRRFTDTLFILGYVITLGRGFVWIFALRRIDLSRAYPVLSLAFPLVLAVSVILFHEQLTVSKCVGSALIVAGVILVGRAK